MNTAIKTVFNQKTHQLLILISLLILPGLNTNAAIYKWVDESGKTHYGSQRPPTAKADRLRIKVKDPVIKKTDEKDTKKDSKSVEKESGKTEPDKPLYTAKEKKALCAQAKSDLASITSRGGRIREISKDGTVRYLTDAERNKRIAETRKDINYFCK